MLGPGESKDCLETSDTGWHAANTMPKPAGVGHCQDVEVDQTGPLLDVAEVCYSFMGGRVRTGSVYHSLGSKEFQLAFDHRKAGTAVGDNCR